MGFRAEGQRIHLPQPDHYGGPTLPRRKPEPFGDSDTRSIGVQAERRSYVFTMPEKQSLRIFRLGVQRGKDLGDRFLEFGQVARHGVPHDVEIDIEEPWLTRLRISVMTRQGTSGCASRTLSLTPRAASPMISIQ
jgi:hypothetical protein